MSSSLTIDYRNPNIIRKMGIDVLNKELGPVGMAYFLQQYDRGDGDYTKERKRLLADVTMEDALRGLDELHRCG